MFPEISCGIWPTAQRASVVHSGVWRALAQASRSLAVLCGILVGPCGSLRDPCGSLRVLAGSLRNPCGILAGFLRDSCGVLAGQLFPTLSKTNSFQIFPKRCFYCFLQWFHTISQLFPKFFPEPTLSNSFPGTPGTPTRIPQGFRKDPARIPHPLREFSFWREFFARYLSVFQFFLRSQLFPTLSHLLAFGPLKFSPKFPHPIVACSFLDKFYTSHNC